MKWIGQQDREISEYSRSWDLQPQKNTVWSLAITPHPVASGTFLPAVTNACGLDKVKTLAPNLYSLHRRSVPRGGQCGIWSALSNGIPFIRSQNQGKIDKGHVICPGEYVADCVADRVFGILHSGSGIRKGNLRNFQKKDCLDRNRKRLMQCLGYGIGGQG